MLAIRCAPCGKPLKVKDEWAGQKVKCPGCGQLLAVPQLPLGVPSAGGPKAVGVANRTLPPETPDKKVGPTGPESVSEVSGPADGTHGGLTEAAPAQRPDREDLDFLAPPQSPDEIGRLGPYRILKVLGAGGMGVVLQGEDPILKRLVAIKAIRPGLGTTESIRKRFLREAQASAAVKHDHIITIYQVGEERGVPYLAMEFLEGEPLDVRLKREGCLPLTEVLRIGREMAEGLAAAHERGLIHRDIKPGNTWLEGKRGRVKILDFGLARLSDGGGEHLTQSGAILGTPQFMAPEQAGSSGVDHRADLFSLGCLLYRASTGQLPFQGADTLGIIMAVATLTPPAPLTLNKDLPPALSDLIMHLLAKDPAARPESAQAVADALRSLQEKEEQTLALQQRRATKRPAQTRPPLQPAPPRGRRRWLVPAALAGGLLLGLMVLLLFLGSGQRPPLANQGPAPENSDPGQAEQPDKGKEAVKIEVPGKAGISTAAEALQALKNGDKDARNRAVAYLRQAAVGGAEQAEIARQLVSLQGQGGIVGVDSALLKWATREQVPALVAWWDRPAAPARSCGRSSSS